MSAPMLADLAGACDELREVDLAIREEQIRAEPPR
jgi:hypothetical protein